MPTAELIAQATADDPTFLLCPEDQLFIRDTLNEQPDPGFRTVAQLQQMTMSDRMLYDHDRAMWHATVPLLRTPQASAVLDQLTMIGTAATNLSMHQQGVPLINGEPGVGKSMIARSYAADEMIRLTVLRELEIERGQREPTHAGTLIRPVIYASLPAALSRIELERHLCELLGWPVARNSSASLAAALQACETKLIVIDEIQFIGFHGATGRQVHNLIRGITNQGVRVLLCGNDIAWVIGERSAPDQANSRRQSRGRWIPLEVPKMPYGEARAKAEWAEVLEEYEQRLRLSNLPPQGWLSRDLAEYTWVSTLGYMISLATLIRNASAAAMISGTERIDRALLDTVRLEDAVEDGRRHRLALLDAGKYVFPKL
ncbi:TniB protein [Curtobacterium sp. JUb34]|uniref:AAA family ATPase n=1 Tax=Curtobacterium sp. JUb34 TaxID=2485109 RepID=UPI000F48B72E|nr:TniB family NTP-binding protein [Curtobacterium sp. JUb34]ROR36641.1 TniB protein [Curtobacterium sp. JUb34]